MRYLYTGTLDEELTAEDILQTIYCADKYNLPQLTDLCLHCVNTHFNADNCLLFLEKVKSAPHDCFAGLLEKCLAVVDAHGRDVVKAEQFSLIGQDTLAMILQRSTLAAEESIIYEAVEKWSREACQRGNLESSQINRRWVLGPALFFVRFPLLTDAQLISGPVASGLLLDSEVRGIYQFKYSHFGCQLPFPTEPREGTVLNVASGGAEFTYKEKVFVDVGSPDDLWVPALIVGIRGAEFAITRVGGETVEWYAMHKIVRASDILQKGQKITLYGEVRESDGTYVGCRAKDVHVVKYGLCGRSEWSGPLCDLRMSREQIAEWKSSNASQLAHVEFQRRLLNDKRW
ncbi:BTB/POZ domain-containing protein 2-like isoform X2 [Paramacrobiotus metropolitanus]|uniref:BTB/POZ domain-containing protein 2-like isoform X2 n=1 Tax=Paramacrobiotus metropolitanus TaxID=2943436 RepID=UPI002445D1BC|nr:BTB/POZ domain-containing protein 2-like isoform X2 [Paramacrobiotus metropolitanus]